MPDDKVRSVADPDRLRVCLVLISGASAKARGTAGTETLAHQQFARLGSAVELDIVTDRDLHPDLMALARSVQRIPVRSVGGLGLFVPRLARVLARGDYDVVLSEGPVPVDVMTGLAAAVTGVPHVLRRHVLIRHIAGGRAKRALYAVADRVPRVLGARYIYLTQAQRAAEGRPARDVVIPNGVDLAHFKPAPAAPDRPLTIGMAAQFIPAKDWPAFLEVARRLIEAAPGSRVIALGDGPLIDEMIVDAADLGLGAAIEFPGNVGDVRPYLARMDALVLTSRREGLSMSAIEALASGVPVVTTPTSGADELVGDGEGGAVVDFQPGAAAAEWVRAQVATVEDREAWRRRARARAEARFDIEDSADRLLATLRARATTGR